MDEPVSLLQNYDCLALFSELKILINSFLCENFSKPKNADLQFIKSCMQVWKFDKCSSLILKFNKFSLTNTNVENNLGTAGAGGPVYFNSGYDYF